jgi:hypothetical protein
MNGDIERLVSEGMDRLVAVTQVPAGLADKARRRCRRRRVALGSAIAGGTAAVAAAAVIAATTAAGPGGQPGTRGSIRAQMDADVVLRHLENAVAQDNLVMDGSTISHFSGMGMKGYISGFAGTSGSMLSTTWAYRSQNRSEEFWLGEPYLDDGTALIGGSLRAANVSYFDHKWNGGGRAYAAPSNACGENAIMMGGPLLPVFSRAFVQATLACGSATVTGRVWINGVDTIEITGPPNGQVDQPGERVMYRLYVNPSTYLPVRVTGSTIAYGPKSSSYQFTSASDVRWLPPSAGNIAMTLVTIPPGFQHVTRDANVQPTSG